MCRREREDVAEAGDRKAEKRPKAERPLRLQVEGMALRPWPSQGP